MSAAQLAQALRKLIAELPVRVTNDQKLISLSAAHIEGIGQACVKVLQAIEAAPQQEPDKLDAERFRFALGPTPKYAICYWDAESFEWLPIVPGDVAEIDEAIRKAQP